jgi:hypothetical protein
MAILGQIRLLGFLIHPVIARPFFFLLAGQRRDDRVDPAVHSELSSAGPEMISGVRASSIRIESTSSTSA